MIAIALLVAELLHAPPALTSTELARYAVQPAQSEVGFHGSSPLHDFTGRTHAVRGEVRTVLADPARYTSGLLCVDARTLDTDNSSRDENMREHLDVERFPQLAFAISSARGHIVDRRGSLSVRGRFTIHGVERERALELTVEPLGEDGLRVRGECSFGMTEHGVERPSVAIFTVADEVQVFVDIALLPAPSEPVPARAYRATIEERTAPVEGEPSLARHEETVWFCDHGAAWERAESGAWIVRRGDATSCFDLTAGRALPQTADAEPAFQEAEQRLARLREKLATLPAEQRERAGAKLQEVIARLEAGLALRPAAGAVQAREEGGARTLALGDATWLTREGRAGDDDLGGLLGALDGLPAELRRALAAEHGVPEHLSLRTALPTGLRTYDIRIAPVQTGTLPSWALAPESWIELACGGEQ